MIMSLENGPCRMQAVNGEISIARNKHGIPVIRSSHQYDMFFGLGAVHAYDRPVEMELVRLVAKGRAAEVLGAGPDDSLLNYDKTMRRYGLWNSAREQENLLESATADLINAYCAGVNQVMKKNDPPAEFLFLEHTPEPWTPADCLLLTDILWLVDMTETQGWMEKFIIQMIQQDVPLPKIKELFRYLADEPDPELSRSGCPIPWFRLRLNGRPNPASRPATTGLSPEPVPPPAGP